MIRDPAGAGYGAMLHKRCRMHARRRGRAPRLSGAAAPKEQPPRKLSGKRTAGGRALWKAAGRTFGAGPLTEGVSRVSSMKEAW